MPKAPFLAPERDDAFKRGRPYNGTTTYYSLPGVVFTDESIATSNNANIDYYSPSIVETPIVVDQFAFEVTTLQAASNARIGLYPADTTWQPAAGVAPLMDSGNISTATTGIKTYTPGTPLVLTRGRYVTVINHDTSGVVIRYLNAMIPGALPQIDTVMGSNAFIGRWRVSRTYAAFPTPGTAWNTVSGGTISFPAILMRITNP